jgi:acyl-CoA thioester hydrolase
MRPEPFVPEILDDERRFVRDKTGGLVWHRVFNRSLYAETDRSKVVYHANFLRYFELGRCSLMRDMGYPYRQVEESGYVYPVVEMGANFYQPLYYDDPMWIHTRPAHLERVRVSFDYLITHEETGAVICTGFTKHCSLNRSGRPTQVDAQTVSMWKSFPT